MTNDLQTAAFNARLKKRYRAEKRFRAYGLTAIILAAAFLFFLLADIVTKATPALTANWLEIKMNIPRQDVENNGEIDPDLFGKLDLQSQARDALQAYFPHVTARTERRQLNALLSSSATAAFQARLAKDHTLLDKDVTAQVLFSDNADLYLKGVITNVREEPAMGRATLTVNGDAVTLVSSQPDFSEEIALLKEQLKRNADALDLELNRLRSAAPEMFNAAIQENLQNRIATLEAQRDALLQRVAAPLQTEPLGAGEPSILVYINGGIVKLTSVAPDRGEGILLLPMNSTPAQEVQDWKVQVIETPETNRRINDQSIVWLEHLKSQGIVKQKFNTGFFTSGDSREPEQAGILGALIGSLLTMMVTLTLCLPIGVAAAIYLEEFAPKNRWTDMVEVNINNLAAVPSIIFGLLGLAIFLNMFNMPRSAPLVGGLVLALLVLPTIIIASRAALRAVPPSIREAALGIGASKQQAVFHHVLPLAMPGIMTGTIISMAHALGETAPLLLIGMVAFIVDVPGGVTSAATVLPVQIYLWSDLPEMAFQAKTAAAILVLLLVLFAMNAFAVILRRRFERRW